MHTADFIYRAAVNTAHTEKICCRENAEILQNCGNLFAGRPCALGGQYLCRLLCANGEMAAFTIYRAGAYAAAPVLFSVCAAENWRTTAWRIAGGRDNPPPAPFIAEKINFLNFNYPAGKADLDLFSDFENHTAQAWLARKK